MDTDKAKNHQYHCCFCRHFQLTGYRWGYCDLLNVYIKGNQDACQVSVPPFAELENFSLVEPQNQNFKSDRSLKV